MKILALILILNFLTVGFASAQEAAPLHVPGVPMKFPVDAASALDHLGRSLLINCETDDLAVNNSCVQGIEERM